MKHLLIIEPWPCIKEWYWSRTCVLKVVSATSNHANPGPGVLVDSGSDFWNEGRIRIRVFFLRGWIRNLAAIEVHSRGGGTRPDPSPLNETLNIFWTTEKKEINEIKWKRKTKNLKFFISKNVGGRVRVVTILFLSTQMLNFSIPNLNGEYAPDGMRQKRILKDKLGRRRSWCLH